jgi:Integrase core domain
VADAKAGLGAWLDFYNEERQHRSLGDRTPRQIYQDGLWICGRSALPTGSAFPASRASSESGEMLVLAHIPKRITPHKGLDIDQVKNRTVTEVVALTAKLAGLDLNKRLRVQALDRTQPLLPMRPSQVERRSHDYERHGTTSLFAAWASCTCATAERCVFRNPIMEVSIRSSASQRTLEVSVPSLVPHI